MNPEQLDELERLAKAATQDDAFAFVNFHEAANPLAVLDLIAAARDADKAHAVLGLVESQLVAACAKHGDDAPLSAQAHLEEAIEALSSYTPPDGKLTEAQVKLRTEVWTAGREMARDAERLREQLRRACGLLREASPNYAYEPRDANEQDIYDLIREVENG